MRDMGLDVPRGLAEVCRPDRLALVVYDMQVGIVSQMKGAPPCVRGRGDGSCQCLEEPTCRSRTARRPLAQGLEARAPRKPRRRISDLDRRGPDGGGRERSAARELAAMATITPGQKIGYVTDAADTGPNRAAIVRLVAGADCLFIEAPFAAADKALAADRAHLTTAAAGEIARQAGVRRVEPFHFSPRYEGEEARMVGEVMAPFGGGAARPGELR